MSIRKVELVRESEQVFLEAVLHDLDEYVRINRNHEGHDIGTCFFCDARFMIKDRLEGLR